MSDSCKVFETALMVERVLARSRTAKADLSDKELAAMCMLISLNPAGRKKYLKQIGVDLSGSDPTLLGLVEKGYLNIRGPISGDKSFIPNKDKIKDELKQHKQPEKYRRPLGVTNASWYFEKSE